MKNQSLKIKDLQEGFGAIKEIKIDQYFITNFFKQHVVFNEFIAKLPRFLVNPIIKWSIYLDKYEEHFREIYISSGNQVRNNCDLTIEHMLSIKNTSNVISNWLKTTSNNKGYT